MDKPVTILVAGGCGVGKSALRWLAPKYWREALGDCAAMDIDDIYMQWDPDWSQKDRDLGELFCENCALLAQNYFKHGFKMVMIVGNGLFHPGVVNRFLPTLLPLSRVRHFTLEADLESVVERVRERGTIEDHPPDFLKGWLELVRAHTGPWTRMIDNTQLTPEQTLDLMRAEMQQPQGAIAELIAWEDEAADG